MSLDELYKTLRQQEQRLLDNWANYDEATEKLLADMEEQVESQRWEELKNGR